MKKIISYNLNGIRSAMDKGLVEWLAAEQADMVCFQETKAQPEQIDSKRFEDLGYHCYWFSAEKKGYSGVGILSKIKPDKVVCGIGKDVFDTEGRIIRADYGNISLFSIYFPSGTTGDIRQEVKMKFLAEFQAYITTFKQEREVIAAGDYNICHTEIDIHNPKSNANTSGFLPEERAWVSDFLASGFVDSFRQFNTQAHQYSWWSYRAGARPKNLGWRIDYHMVSQNLAQNLHGASILPQVVHSDHCPVVIEIDF